MTPAPPTYSTTNKAWDSERAVHEAREQLNRNSSLLTLFQSEDQRLRVISHPENASGFALFPSFPYTEIYVTKHRLKSKGKSFVLIGLCIVSKIGLVKGRVGRGYNPH